MTPESPVPSRNAWGPRVVLVALFALFMVPILGAMFLNVVVPSWLPFGKVNRGTLVVPAQPVGDGLLAQRQEKSRGGPAGEPTWMLVHVGDPPCEKRCEQALASIRQARLALGKDAPRVERWWLMTRPSDARTVVWARQNFPGLLLGTVETSSPLIRESVSVQVVDPAGFLILRYENPDAASDLLKDLKRLLKVSKQG